MGKVAADKSLRVCFAKGIALQHEKEGSQVFGASFNLCSNGYCWDCFCLWTHELCVYEFKPCQGLSWNSSVAKLPDGVAAAKSSVPWRVWI